MVFLMVSYISILLFLYLTRSCLRSPDLFFYSLTHLKGNCVSSVVAPALLFSSTCKFLLKKSYLCYSVFLAKMTSVFLVFVLTNYMRLYGKRPFFKFVIIFIFWERFELSIQDLANTVFIQTRGFICWFLKQSSWSVLAPAAVDQSFQLVSRGSRGSQLPSQIKSHKTDIQSVCWTMRN